MLLLRSGLIHGIPAAVYLLILKAVVTRSKPFVGCKPSSVT